MGLRKRILLVSLLPLLLASVKFCVTGKKISRKSFCHGDAAMVKSRACQEAMQGMDPVVLSNESYLL